MAALHVERVGNAVPMAVRLSRRWLTSDYIVVDADGEPVSEPRRTMAEAETDLQDLAASEVQ